jgi:drug/metabolite transporter (DMT)-like permease
MIVSTTLTQILSKTTELLPGVKSGTVDSSVIKTKVFPIAALFAVSLICANKAYLFLSVSYIQVIYFFISFLLCSYFILFSRKQMLKASTPVVVLIISIVGGLENSTFIELNIVMLISLGVALASLGELMFSWNGFVFQVLAIVAEASRLVLTGLILKKYKLDSLSTLYYVAPLCAVLNGICCLYFEWSFLPWERIFTYQFIGLLILNGLVAFSLNIASVMLIGHTSALTLTLAGIVKDILLVFLSMSIFLSPVTILQFLGYAVALLALNLHKEYKKNQALFESNKESNENHPSKV